MITDSQSGTNVHEIAENIFRINTPVEGFSFNQYLIAADQPLLFHTGPRRMFSLVRTAVSRVVPVENLRFIGLSHVEADECGSLNQWLAAAPRAAALCGSVAAMTSIEDMADRAPRALADGETLSLGRHAVTWLDAPHLPHGWECGFLMEERSRTLLCGDLFTQPGKGQTPLTESDILAPSEAFRKEMDYFAHSRDTTQLLAKLAKGKPQTLACMHGSAWAGDGAGLLMALAAELAVSRQLR